MPRVLFTPETARILAKKSHEARKAARLASVERERAVATVIATAPGGRLETASRAAKHNLSEELLSQIALLRTTPAITHKELANSPDGEGRASLVARITDTAAKVYGWDSEKGNTLIMIGLVDRLDPDNAGQTVEVESEVKP